MSTQAVSNSKKVIVSILVIAFVMYGQAICAPLVANIIADTPNYAPTTTSMVMTMPTFGIMIASIAYGVLSRKLSNRVLLIIATILYAAGGLLPIAIWSNIPLFLVCRVILGLGVGVYISMPLALVAQNFKGNSGAKVQGFIQASASVGAIILQMLSGKIAMADWRMSMWLSGLCIVCCIIALICLPKQEKNSDAEAAAEKARKEEAALRKGLPFLEKYPPIVILYIVEIFFFIAGIGVLMQNCAIITAAVGGAATDAASVISAHNLIGFLMGLVFGFLFMRTREYTLAIAAALAAVAYFLLGTASSMPAIFAGSILVGLAAPTSAASFSQLIGKYAHPAAAGMAISVMVALQFFGQFLMGFWMPVVCNMLGLDAAGGFAPFQVYTVIYAVLFILFIVQAVTGQKRRQAKVEAAAQGADADETEVVA